MNIQAIVYCSSAGTTEKYALRLGEHTGLPVLPLKKAVKERPEGSVLFMSWICAGILMSYEKAASVLNIGAVCAVGIGKEEQAFADLKKNQSLEGDDLFFLPGAFNMKKISLIHRRAMKNMEYEVTVRVKRAKLKGEPHPTDLAVYNMFRFGSDHYDETRLDPVIRLLEKQPKNPLEL